MTRGRLILLVALWCLASLASAHDMAVSAIRFIVRRSDTVVSVSFHQKKVEGTTVNRVVRDRLKVRIDGRSFIPGVTHVVVDSTNDLVTWQATYPKVAKEFEVEQRLFPEDSAASTVVTVTQEGVVQREVILDAQHPAWRKSEPEVTTGEIGLRFVRQGVEHILSGADHVLFVLGLILLGAGVRSLLKTVTAFTIAHSVTLSLAVTGVLNPPSRIVEPLIALSIVAIAIENLRPKTQQTNNDYRPLMAFGFGLVHGFGFAGAMSNLGLTGQPLVVALGTFNLGVECGQAAIVLVAWPVFQRLAKRHPVRWPRVAGACSAIIGLVGTYWFISRVFGA